MTRTSNLLAIRGQRSPYGFGITTVTLVALAFSTAFAKPPGTRKEPVTDNYHGTEIIDNYRWLEHLESESEEVKDWTTRQNDATRRILDVAPFRPHLEARLRDLIRMGSIRTPKMRKNRYFYTRREGDENQPTLYVRDGVWGERRVLIDPNTLDDKGLYSLDWYEPSANAELLAFGMSHAGKEMPVLRILNVENGEWLADEISGKAHFCGWRPDGAGFLYRVLDNPEDPYSSVLRYHRIGRHHRHDLELFRQQEPTRIPWAWLSSGGKWITLGVSNGWSKRDLYAINAVEWFRTGKVERIPIAVDLGARFEDQEVLRDTLYMRTTLDAPNGQLFAVDLLNPSRDKWRLLVPERQDAVLNDAFFADDLFVCAYEREAISEFECRDMDGSLRRKLELPGSGTAYISTHYDRTEAFIHYQSYNEPPTVYHYDLKNGQRKAWDRLSVPVDPDAVVVKHIHYTSKDGTEVPMFIAHRRDVKLDGNNPCLLYGYGGFNISISPHFIAGNYPWLESGGIHAIPSLRGGGEKGESWHKAGMLGNKQNVFDDFYAAAEYLIEKGYTRSDRLACWGGSNGGLLTGVAITQRPKLFRAAISSVPLLDMLRFHKFLMARFWIPEYGSSEDPEQFGWLRTYSPYHNVRPGQRYPAIFFTTGENDARVHPLHARKMAALLQANDPAPTDDNPVLLWVDRSAGHGQGKPFHLRLQHTVDKWTFLMVQTGVKYSATR